MAGNSKIEWTDATMILTKRPDRMRAYFDLYCDVFQPIKNLWLGVTAENQKAADERIPILLEIPAAVRFVSVEPMLEAIELEHWLEFFGSEMCSYGVNHKKGNCDCRMSHLDWVICGAETGPKARVMKSEWANDLWEQCDRAAVPFFFKKESPSDPVPEHIKVREFPK